MNINVTTYDENGKHESVSALEFTGEEWAELERIRELENVRHPKNRAGLSPSWCEREDCEFRSYPQYGECSCGLMKEHVHCQHGYVIQVG